MKNLKTDASFTVVIPTTMNMTHLSKREGLMKDNSDSRYYMNQVEQVLTCQSHLAS